MKKVFLAIVFSVSSLIIFPLSTFSADDLGEEIRLYMGEVKLVKVSTPARIVIGNPNIADVSNISKSDITVIPKGVGRTTLVIWDNFGEQSFQIKVFSEDISDLKRRADNLLATLNLTGVYTQLAEEEGKIILLGKIKSNQDRERIATALGALKDKTVDLTLVKEEEAVIDIDVQVLELNKDAEKTLGMTWPGTVTTSEVGSPGILPTGTQLGGLFRIFNFKRSEAFSWTLDALVQEGKARILSRPRLACQSGKEAELLVGGEKPIMTTQAVYGGGTGTSVEYKEYGIKLKIKPTVNEDRRIKLALSVEVSDVGTAETLGTTTTTGSTTTTAKAYPLSKRNASTELYMDDGQTLAIGGLIKQKSSEDIRKTPFLGDVPILGMAFRKKTTKAGGGVGEKGDTELFITITPRIVSSPELAAKEARQEIKEEIPPSGQGLQKSSSLEEAAVLAKETPAKNTPPVAPKAAIDPVAEYSNIVQQRIIKNLSYPPKAKEAGLGGTLKLSLRLGYNGKLLEAVVKDSSGSKILDDHAIAVAKGVGSFPPFPSSIEQKELWVDVPIAYRLD